MAETPAVRVERDGPVTTVILSRPDVRNAVDGPTAAALADAFLAFERDPDAQVGGVLRRSRHVLRGRGSQGRIARRGARARARQSRREPVTGSDWNPLATDGPMGPSRMLLVEAGDRGGLGPCGGGRARARALVRPARRRGGRGVRRVLPPLGRAADRRRHRAAAADRRPRPRARPDPHRPARSRADEALAIGLANRVVPRGAARREAEALARELAPLPADLHARRPPLGLRAVGPAARRGAARRMGASASRRSAPARRSRARRASPRGTAAAAASTICERDRARDDPRARLRSRRADPRHRVGGLRVVGERLPQITACRSRSTSGTARSAATRPTSSRSRTCSRSVPVSTSRRCRRSGASCATSCSRARAVRGRRRADRRGARARAAASPWRRARSATGSSTTSSGSACARTSPRCAAARTSRA